MAKVGKLFGIYHVMEEKGVFEANKANASSSGYVKADYPRMLYHPLGKSKVVFAGISEVDPHSGRTKIVGAQTEIINRIVGNKAEEDEWLAKGWHLHPVEAMRAAGVVDLPATSSQARIDELEASLKATQLELDRAKRSKIADALDEDVA